MRPMFSLQVLLVLNTIFDIPLVLSVDVRPEFRFGDVNNQLEFDLGISLRYQF